MKSATSISTGVTVRIHRLIVVAVLSAAFCGAQVTINPAPAGNWQALLAHGTPMEGETIGFEVLVGPGDLTFLVFSLVETPSSLLGGVLLVDPNTLISGVIPKIADENGIAKHEFRMPFTSPGFSVVAQAGLFHNGNPYLTNSVTITTLPLVTGIERTSPTASESDVALTRETIFEFSRPIDSNTVSSSAIYATFAGQTLPGSLHVAPDQRRVTLFYADPLPANSTIRVTVDGSQILDHRGGAVDVDGDGVHGGLLEIDFDTVTLTTLPGTSVYGRVFASELGPGGFNVPLEGVTISVDGSQISTQTDAQGNFTLSPAPVGTFFVHIDGSTASGTPAGFFYPNVGKSWHSVAGSATCIGDIHLPAVSQQALVPVSASQSTTIGFHPTQLAGIGDPSLLAALQNVSITVPPDSLFADDGSRGGMVGIAPVAPDRLPGELPDGIDLPIVITVQTDGATNFDVPVPVAFPNLPNPVTGVTLPPGAKTSLASFNHDTGRWEMIGPMTVSADGSLLVTDPGVGILAPGWHGTPECTDTNGPNSSPPPCPNWARDCGTAIASNSIPCAMAIVTDLLVAAKGYKAARCGFEVVNNGAGAAAACLDAYMNSSSTWSSSSCAVGLVGLAASCAESIPILGSLIACGGGLLGAIGGCSCGAEEGGGASMAPLTHHVALAVALDQYYEVLFGSTVLSNQVPEDPIDDLFALEQTQDIINAILDAGGWSSPGGPSITASEQSSILALPRSVNLSVADLSQVFQYWNQTHILWSQGVFTHAQAGRSDFVDVGIARNKLLDVQNAIADMQAAGLPYVDFGDSLFDAVAAAYEDSVHELDPPMRPEDVYYLLDIRILQSPGNTLQIQTRGTNSSFPPTVPPGAVARISQLHGPTQTMSTVTIYTSQAGTETVVPNSPFFPTETEADTDGDGLADVAENIVGTDPANPDTDGDGVDDRTEIEVGRNPLDGIAVATGIIASANTPGTAIDVDAFDEVAVIADGPAGVTVFNVFNGMDPVIVGQVDTPGSAQRVALSGNFVAVADGASGLAIVDISDPPAAFVAHQIPLDSAVISVAARGPVGYAGTASGRIITVVLATGEILDDDQIPGSVRDLALDADTLCAYRPSVIHTFEVFAGGIIPAGSVVSPFAVNPDQIPPFTDWRIFAGGGLVYHVHRRGLSSFDISDTSQPTLIHQGVTSSAHFSDVALNGSGLAIAPRGFDIGVSNDMDVSLYDASSATNTTTLLGVFDTPGAAFAVSIYNGFAYIADNLRGLQVVNYTEQDMAGQAPSVSLSTSSAQPGVVTQLEVLRVTATATDDVQVRNVEFFVDDVLVVSDGDFPFEFRFAVPSLLLQPTVDIRADAIDTGGNRASTGNITFAIAPDVTPPVFLESYPSHQATIGVIDARDRILAFFSEAIDLASVDGGGVDVVSAGPDGILGTGDDVSIALQPSTQPLSGRIVLRLPALAPNSYRATFSANIADPAGNLAGSPTILDFTVVDGDADGDGLSDFAELTVHLTDPFNVDSDGDGLSDSHEVQVSGGDPNSADSDGDGLSDFDEWLFGSDPNVADTVTELNGVVELVGGAPAAGALVHVVGQSASRFLATTDASGGFAILGWPSTASPVRVVASADVPGSAAIYGFSAPTATMTGSTPLGFVVLDRQVDGAPFPSAAFSAGASPEALAAGDLNGDGREDVVVASPGAGELRVMLAGLAGTFSLHASLAVAGAPADVALRRDLRTRPGRWRSPPRRSPVPPRPKSTASGAGRRTTPARTGRIRLRSPA